MDYFNYQNGALYAEQTPVAKIAEQFGTPCYVYSRATLERHWYAFANALTDYPHLICYAVKANSNLAILNLLAKLGAGFDIVSVGELERVLAAGGDASKVVFSGVAKEAHEIERAQQAGIYCFNVESAAELELINTVCGKLNKPAPIAFRVNPDIDPQTHPYISTGLKDSKFGIDINHALSLYKHATTLPFVQPIGIACHIGSQLTSLEPFLAALDRVLLLQQQLQAEGITLQHIDVGGGLGVCYANETPPHPSQYADALLKKFRNSKLRLILEPGRTIAANSGILVTRVAYQKHSGDKHFLLIDAGMNDLLRPTLYQAWHDIVPVQQREDIAEETYDIVGPVCESGDFLGKERNLRATAGDLLAVRSAGAYAFSMSSQYNSRPRAAEILVDGDTAHLIRRRETIEELFAHENIVDEL